MLALQHDLELQDEHACTTATHRQKEAHCDRCKVLAQRPRALHAEQACAHACVHGKGARHAALPWQRWLAVGVAGNADSPKCREPVK